MSVPSLHSALSILQTFHKLDPGDVPTEIRQGFSRCKRWGLAGALLSASAKDGVPPAPIVCFPWSGKPIQPRDTHLLCAKKVMCKTTKKGKIGTPARCGHLRPAPQTPPSEAPWSWSAAACSCSAPLLKASSRASASPKQTHPDDPSRGDPRRAPRSCFCFVFCFLAIHGKKRGGGRGSDLGEGGGVAFR